MLFEDCKCYCRWNGCENGRFFFQDIFQKVLAKSYVGGVFYIFVCFIDVIGYFVDRANLVIGDYFFGEDFKIQFFYMVLVEFSNDWRKVVVLFVEGIVYIDQFYVVLSCLLALSIIINE